MTRLQQHIVPALTIQRAQQTSKLNHRCANGPVLPRIGLGIVAYVRQQSTPGSCARKAHIFPRASVASHFLPACLLALGWAAEYDHDGATNDPTTTSNANPSFFSPSRHSRQVQLQGRKRLATSHTHTLTYTHTHTHTHTRTHTPQTPPSS
jgi:hypothetical protein